MSLHTMQESECVWKPRVVKELFSVCPLGGEAADLLEATRVSPVHLTSVICGFQQINVSFSKWTCVSLVLYVTSIYLIIQR